MYGKNYAVSDPNPLFKIDWGGHPASRNPCPALTNPLIATQNQVHEQIPDLGAAPGFVEQGVFVKYRILALFH
jgi:hypothetical protein